MKEQTLYEYECECECNQSKLLWLSLSLPRIPRHSAGLVDPWNFELSWSTVGLDGLVQRVLAAILVVGVAAAANGALDGVHVAPGVVNGVHVSVPTRAVALGALCVGMKEERR